MNLTGLLPVSPAQIADTGPTAVGAVQSPALPVFGELVSALLGGSDIVSAEVIGGETTLSSGPTAGEVAAGNDAESPMEGVHPVLVAEAILRYMTCEAVTAPMSDEDAVGEETDMTETPITALDSTVATGSESSDEVDQKDPDSSPFPGPQAELAALVGRSATPTAIPVTPATTEPEVGGDRPIIDPSSGRSGSPAHPVTENGRPAGSEGAGAPGNVESLASPREETAPTGDSPSRYEDRTTVERAHTAPHPTGIERPEHAVVTVSRTDRDPEFSPATMSAAASRVEQAVRRLENAPPPNVVTFTIEEFDLRLTVALRPDGIHLSSPGQSSPATGALIRSLESALQSRGFDLSQGDRGRRDRERPEAPWQPSIHPTRTRRSAAAETRL